MSNRLIPFYTKYKNTDQNYTLFIDHESNRVYKAYHQKSNNMMYIFAFVIVLAVLRAVQEFEVTNSLMYILILIGILASIFIGIYAYKKFTYEELREVFFTENELNEHVKQGKKVLNTEIWVIAIIALFFYFYYSYFY